MELLLLLALPLLIFGFGDQGGSEDTEIDGTPGDDTIEGTNRADQISAGDGSDFVNGLSGNDEIDSGTGDDLVFGGPGNDVIRMDSGDDFTADHRFDDNDDLIYFPEWSAGNDFIYGGAGNDGILDSNGVDTLSGNTGADLLSSLDHLGNDDAHDVVYGGYGADSIFADKGDVVTGNQGNDSFYVWMDQTTADPVIITDFDGASDELELNVNSDNFPDLSFADLTSQTDTLSGDVTLAVQGHVIAILNNPTAFDLSQVNLVQNAGSLPV